MTCRCGGEFCWICGRNWKTHDQGSCPFREEFERLEAERKRRLEDEKGYREKFEAAKVDYERFSILLETFLSMNYEKIQNDLQNQLKILNSESYFIKDYIESLIMGYSYLKWVVVAKFFERGDMELLNAHMVKVIKYFEELDQFILDFIPQVLDSLNLQP